MLKLIHFVLGYWWVLVIFAPLLIASFWMWRQFHPKPATETSKLLRALPRILKR